jgi:hypothetical protein
VIWHFHRIVDAVLTVKLLPVFCRSFVKETSTETYQHIASQLNITPQKTVMFFITIDQIASCIIET